MYGDRSFSLLVQPDQWARCAHQNTALLAGGGVELDWADSDPSERCDPAPARPAAVSGLAFDRWCRSYRSRTGTGAVEVAEARTVPMRADCPGPLDRPTALAVDSGQRLYVIEAGTGSVLVVDLIGRRVLRRIALGRHRPVDLVAECGRALLLCRRPDALYCLDGRRGPRPGPVLVRPRCAAGLPPRRVTVGWLVLWSDGRTGVIARPDGTVELEVDGATDLEVDRSGLLVVARGPGRSLRRFQRDATSGWTELEPVGAPGYDGGALTFAPDGRIAYTTSGGWQSSSGSVARHQSEGTVTSYRLDSGSYRTRWGRMFLQACLPVHTSVRVRWLTSDEDEVPDPIPASPPSRGARSVPHPEQTPPLPPATLLAALPADGAPLYRRGAEDPWQPGPDGFASYEAPVAAPPGRYLWLQLQLTGTAGVTPRVRGLRIERPGHRLLSSLPRAWSRQEQDAAWLQQFLAPAEGMLDELDWQAAQRSVLLDPRATPAEALPWLASFAGLVLDQRWPEPARRTLVAEAYSLFARRGTKQALVRTLGIYLGRDPVLVERWQLRGLGGTVLGVAEPEPAPRVGANLDTGTLGRFTIGGRLPHDDSFRASAHRFTVLIPGTLTAEQREVVQDLLDSQRPAHTLVDLCELGSGMRVGSRLRVALTSFIGPGAQIEPAVLGEQRLGTDGSLGVAAVGSRLGQNSATGRVLVG
jgi:phage tail-like protein